MRQPFSNSSDSLISNDYTSQDSDANLTLVPRPVLRVVLALFLIFSIGGALADQKQTDEPYATGWSIQIDNDFLVGGSRDQDYTGGFILSLSGKRAAEYLVSPIRALDWLDGIIGLNSLLQTQSHYTVNALEFGAALFTPVNIQESSINTQDRPYASLFFLNGTRQSIIPSHKLSVRSSLTVGLLGLDLANSVQSNLHSALGATQPQGWNNQISQGGEVTIKYSVGLQKAAFQRRFDNGLGVELNWTAQADLGFTTGLSVGLNSRFGKINTPWWSFNPHQSDYVNLGSNINPGLSSASTTRERYFYAGFSLTRNVYNAFLQGQLRRSAFTVQRSDIVDNIAEVWIGSSVEVANGYKIDIFARARSRELRLTDADRLAWGGLIISRSI